MMFVSKKYCTNIDARRLITYNVRIWSSCITILPQIIVEVMFTSRRYEKKKETFIFKTNLVRNQEKSFLASSILNDMFTHFEQLGYLDFYTLIKLSVILP
jgi:hypothetical protein